MANRRNGRMALEWRSGWQVATTQMLLVLILGIVAVSLTAAGEKRWAVPSQEQLKSANELLAEIFGEDLGRAKNASDQLKLAAMLAQQGRGLRDEPAMRFALLERARQLAAQSGDSAQALAYSEELTKQFDLVPILSKADTLAMLSRSTNDAAGQRSLVELMLSMIQEALDADQYDTARNLGRIANEAATRTGDSELKDEVRRKNEAVQSVEQGFLKLRTHIERLAKDPNDGAANLELGKYYGFLKRNWKKAMPLLAMSNQGDLKSLAERDIRTPKSSADQLALADAWWEMAQGQNEPAQTSLQQRASYWYDQAIPQLTGLSRIKAQRRSEAVQDRLAGSLTTPAVGPGGELKKFEGHTDEIKSVAFSSDGRLAVSGGLDQSVRVWDLQTGQPDKLLQGHSKQVWSVAFLPNQRRVLSGSWDVTVRLWDVGTGAEVRRFTHRIDVNGVAVSRDGDTFLSGSDDHNVYLWNTNTGEQLKKYVGHSNFVYSVAFSHDGTQIASGSLDKSVRVFDLNTGSVVRVFDGHSEKVSKVLFTPDNRFVLSAGDNVRQWDLASGKESKKFEGFKSAIAAIALSPDGRRLIVGDDSVIRILDMFSGKEIAKLEGHTDKVTALAISPDGRRLLSGSMDRTVRLWGLSAR